jgi:hypothetical protein
MHSQSTLHINMPYAKLFLLSPMQKLALAQALAQGDNEVDDLIEDVCKEEDVETWIDCFLSLYHA